MTQCFGYAKLARNRHVSFTTTSICLSSDVRGCGVTVLSVLECDTIDRGRKSSVLQGLFTAQLRVFAIALLNGP